MTRVAAVIPARYASTRFPGKVLAGATGRPLVQHVWERARAARLVERVLVACDDRRIAEAVEAFGGEAVMTRADHPNGTSRIAELAPGLEAAHASAARRRQRSRARPGRRGPEAW